VERTMLTAIARQAIIDCLTELGIHARDEQLPLLAAMIQTRVLDHPDRSAQYLYVNPLPVPEQIWAQADSPVAGLRRAADDLHTSSVQTQLAAAPPDLHLVAWVFMYAEVITDDDGAVPVRVIEAVDIDDRTYLHTRPPVELDGRTTIRTADAAEDSDQVAILRGLARELRTS
jgi:hypothetical protein